VNVEWERNYGKIGWDGGPSQFLPQRTGGGGPANEKEENPYPGPQSTSRPDSIVIQRKLGNPSSM